jgi:cytochrome P450
VHPPTAGLFPKRVPDGGDTVVVDGMPVFLPGGTNVSYARYAVLMDKRVYGEDADEFHPERWLVEKDEAKLAAMHKSHDLIFGYGRYQCLGKPVALMEIGKAVFEVCGAITPLWLRLSGAG